MAWGSGFAKHNLLRFQNKTKLNQKLKKNKHSECAALLISMSDDQYTKFFYLKFHLKYIIY